MHDASPSPPRAAPPAPAARWRRWALGGTVAFAAALILAALGLVATWQALGTDRGTAWLLSHVSGLTVQDPRGSLRGGAFSASGVDFRTRNGATHVHIDDLRWRDLRWQWRPVPGLWLGLSIDGLQAQRIEVQHSATPGAAGTAGPRDLHLPLALALHDARVQTLQLGTQSLRDLQTSLQLEGDAGRVHRIDHLAFNWDRLHLEAQGRIGLAGAMPVQAQARLHSLPASDPAAATIAWQASLQAAGPVAHVAVDGHLAAHASTTSTAPDAALDLHAMLAPLAPWPLEALRAQLQAVDLAALSSQAPHTQLSGQATLESSGLAQPARVELHLTNALPGRWDEDRVPLRGLQLALRGQPNRLDTVRLDQFDAELGDANGPAGRWRGQGAWRDGRLALQTTVTDLQPAALDHRLAAMRLGGPVTLDLAPLQPGGWQASLQAQLDGQASAPGAGRHGSPPAALPARIALQGSAQSVDHTLSLRLPTVHASVAGAEAEASAQAERTEGAWHLVTQGRLTRFDPARWWPGTPGSAWRAGPHRLDGRWDADLHLGAAASTATSPASGPPRGRATGPTLRGRIALQLAPTSQLAGVPLRAELHLNASGRGPAGVTAQAELGGNHLGFDGAIDLDGHPSADHWTLDLQAAQLATLAPLLRLAPATAAFAPDAGQARLHMQAQGRWPHLRTAGEASVQQLSTASRALAMALAQAHWQLGSGGSDAMRMQLVVQGAQLGVQRVDELHADLSGTATDQRWRVDARSPLHPPAWIATLLGPTAQHGIGLEAAGTGHWSAGREGARGGSHWQAHVEQLRVGPPAAEAAAGTATPAAASSTALAPAAAASSPPSPTAPSPPAPAPRTLLAASGLTLDLDLADDWAPLRAQLQPGELRALGSRWRWTQARWQAGDAAAPATTDLQAELQPLSLAPLLAKLQPDFGWGGDLALVGHARLHTGAHVQADVVIERQAGDLHVTDEGGTQALGLSVLRLGVAADAGIWHFTEAAAGSTIGVLAGAQSLRVPASARWPAADTPLEGVLELRVDNLGVWGPWTPPGWRLAGTLHVSATLGGRFAAPEYTGQIEGHELGARNLLAGINVTHGDLLISLDGPTAQIRRFTLQGGEGLLRVQGGADFGASPSAQLQLGADRFQWVGRVDRRLVASGQAQLALTRDAVVLDGRVAVDDGLIDFSRSNAPTLDDDVSVVRPVKPGEAAAPAAGPQRRIDVHLLVDLGDRLRVRGHGLDTRLRGQLTMTTPNNRLAVRGTVTAADGTYAAYGQKLQIARGIVDFNGPLDDPRLDILALRPNLDVQVGVAITGTAQNPRVRLYSDPDMSDNDKLSWLVLGRAPEGLGRSDAAILQRAAMALLTGESGGGSDKVLRLLGLDDLSVQQAGDNDVRSTVVTVGKQISQRWYVSYEHSMENTTGTWQLIYRIAQRFMLRAQSGNDNAVDLIWNWHWK